MRKNYGTYVSREVFDQIDMSNLGRTILKFKHKGFSKSYGGIVSSKTFAWNPEDIISLSGTIVRAMLADGQRPPAEISRPEVADILMEADKDKTW